MSDDTTTFFAELGARGHDPMLGRVTGTVGFDLTNGKKSDHWRVEIKKGTLNVTRGTEEADCTVHTDRALFDEIASGRTNALAALLRGAMAVEGDLEMLMLFQRLLPGPPPSTQKPETVAATGDRR